MDETGAAEEQAAATPIFNVYRRGYDPEQVDRYVGDQQRRLDEAVHRASESERKLAAAVGQLRELHRRVAVYESEVHNTQPAQLDTLGERVQRILQEAWEGAYNLRQEAEQEVNELREGAEREAALLRERAKSEVEELRQVASKEAAEAVDEATRRALSIRDETERRRQTYLEQVERDRERAIAQLSYLYDQREGAVAELVRLQATVQATVEELVRSPLARPSAVTYGAGGAVTDGVAGEGPAADEGDADPAEATDESAEPVTAAGEVTGDTKDTDASAGEVEADGPPAETSDDELASDGSDASVAPAPRKSKKLSSVKPEPADIAPASGATGADADDSGDAEGTVGAEGGASSETPGKSGLGADEPTVPMERFVLPRDREAARAAMRPGSEPTVAGRDAEVDTAEPGSGEGTVGAGGGERPEEAISRQSSRRGFDRSPAIGVTAADTLPLQPGETAAPDTLPLQAAETTAGGSDSAARPPVVKPKNGLFDVEQEGWA